MKIEVGEAPVGFEFTGEFRKAGYNEWYFDNGSPCQSVRNATDHTYPILRRVVPPKTMKDFLGKRFKNNDSYTVRLLEGPNGQVWEIFSDLSGYLLSPRETERLLERLNNGSYTELS